MIILTFLTDFFEYLDQNYKFLWNKKIIKSFCMKISQITLIVRSLPRILWYGFWTLRNTHLPSSYLKRENQILRRHLLWKFFFAFPLNFDTSSGISSTNMPIHSIWFLRTWKAFSNFLFFFLSGEEEILQLNGTIFKASDIQNNSFNFQSSF